MSLKLILCLPKCKAVKLWLYRMLFSIELTHLSPINPFLLGNNLSFFIILLCTSDAYIALTLGVVKLLFPTCFTDLLLISNIVNALLCLSALTITDPVN